MVPCLAEVGILAQKIKIWLKTLILFLFSAILLAIGFNFVYPDVSILKKENPKKTSFMEFRERECERAGKR